MRPSNGRRGRLGLLIVLAAGVAAVALAASPLAAADNSMAIGHLNQLIKFVHQDSHVDWQEKKTLLADLHEAKVALHHPHGVSSACAWMFTFDADTDLVVHPGIALAMLEESNIVEQDLVCG